MTIQNRASILFILLTSFVCIYTFNIKYLAISLADGIRKVGKDIQNEKRRSKLLKAEWQALTAPNRINVLAKKFLNSEKHMETVRLYHGGESVLFQRKSAAELNEIIEEHKTDGK